MHILPVLWIHVNIIVSKISIYATHFIFKMFNITHFLILRSNFQSLSCVYNFSFPDKDMLYIGLETFRHTNSKLSLDSCFIKLFILIFYVLFLSFSCIHAYTFKGLLGHKLRSLIITCTMIVEPQNVSDSMGWDKVFRKLIFLVREPAFH
jgi:hypothetical protein